jgi:DNA mismatch repair ATPase MutS
MTRMATEVAGVKNMFTTCRVENGALMLEYKVEEGKMQKSYGIEVMKILNFPEEVVTVAENYLEYYETDEQEDAVLNQLSEETKDQLLVLHSQMEESLSHSPVAGHEEIKVAFKSKMQEVLGMAG